MTNLILLQMSEKDMKSLFTETIREELKKIIIPSNDQKDVDLLCRKEAARILGISLPTLSKLIKQGYIKPKILGTLIRFDKHEIEECLNYKSLKNASHGR